MEFYKIYYSISIKTNNFNNYKSWFIFYIVCWEYIILNMYSVYIHNTVPSHKIVFNKLFIFIFFRNFDYQDRLNKTIINNTCIIIIYNNYYYKKKYLNFFFILSTKIYEDKKIFWVSKQIYLWLFKHDYITYKYKIILCTWKIKMYKTIVSLAIHNNKNEIHNLFIQSLLFYYFIKWFNNMFKSILFYNNVDRGKYKFLLQYCSFVSWILF